jgi:hypothetical protein
MSTDVGPRLAPALVPAPLWGRSVYQLLRGTRRGGDWKRLRADVVARAGGDCHICGEHQDRFMVCHEVWDYDDDAGVATLVDFALNCWGCDAATHPGCAGLTGRRETARGQLEKVNGLSAEEVEDLIAAAREEWTRRSQQRWTVAVSDELCRRYPVLVGLFDDSNDEKGAP